MYEHKKEALLEQKAFVIRLLWHLAAALLFILITLIVGAIGHMYFEGVPFHDAFLNSSLIMGGVGTTFLPESLAGKVFFSIYGLFVGVLFAALVGVVLAPVIHRIVHKMHLDEDDSL